MRRFCATLLLPALTALLGCPYTIKEEVYPKVDRSQPRFEADRDIPYQDYLILMDGGQRRDFFELDTASKKKRYLLENGITVRKMLVDNLSRGMTKSSVEKVLGVPERKELEDYANYSASRYDRVVDEWWVYQETDSGNLVFLPFKDGWLVDWLVDRKTRDMVFMKTPNQDLLVKKRNKLIHLQEEIPSLLRMPGEELEAYRARLRKVAPVVYSESPPRWPNLDHAREMVKKRGYSQLTSRDVYGLWGKTAKVFELGLKKNPTLPYDRFTRWVYRVFNGRDFTIYSVYFKNDQLVDWEVSDRKL